MHRSLAPLLAASVPLLVSPGPAQEAPPAAGPESPSEVETRGLVLKSERACPGYTLFAPLRTTTTYLIDLDGTVVHQWESAYTPGNAVYLLDDGSILRCAREPGQRRFRGGGQGGRVQRLSWDGELLWDFAYAGEERLHHHDLEPLPNGNVLLIAWEARSAEQARQAGRAPALLQGSELWPDFVVEIEPAPPDGGKTVWEWHAWDHLVQDQDPTLPNHGAIAEHPGRVDVNGDRRREEVSEQEQQRLAELGYAAAPEQDREQEPRPRGRRGREDWLHTNSIDYHPGLDQILLSVRSLSEIWIIDHSTSSAEAAGRSGGRAGQGGDLLYRWGNPQIYGLGGAADQQLYVQHDARWIEEGCPGAGNFLVFNNGSGRPGGNYSTVDEIVPPLAKDGSYRREPGRPYGPEKPIWSWPPAATAPGQRFYSSHISGAQRLPNGNTLVCLGEGGRLVEVSAAGEVVWEYLNPFGSDRRPEDGPPGPPPGESPPLGGGPPPERGERPPMDGKALFRATRLPLDHPGLARLDSSK